MGTFWKVLIAVVLVLTIVLFVLHLRLVNYLQKDGAIVPGQRPTFYAWVKHTTEELHEVVDWAITKGYGHPGDHHNPPPPPPDW
jgi:hypothetical protein